MKFEYFISYTYFVVGQSAGNPPERRFGNDTVQLSERVTTLAQLRNIEQRMRDDRALYENGHTLLGFNLLRELPGGK